jgi:hypothetical protein
MLKTDSVISINSASVEGAGSLSKHGSRCCAGGKPPHIPPIYPESGSMNPPSIHENPDSFTHFARNQLHGPPTMRKGIIWHSARAELHRASACTGLPVSGFNCSRTVTHH